MKRALVTGGSGDLGGAICKRLAADGLEVIVHANSNQEKAEQIAGDIRTNGGTALAVSFDVTDPDSIRLIVTHRTEAPIELFSLDGRPHLAWVRIETTKVSSYQALLQETTS